MTDPLGPRQTTSTSGPAIKLLGAGMAGLEALPKLLVELARLGVPLLPPLALDHDEAQIQKYSQAMVAISPEIRDLGYEPPEPEWMSRPITGSGDLLAVLKKVNSPSLSAYDESGAALNLSLPSILWAWVELHHKGLWDNIKDELANYPGKTTRFMIVFLYSPGGSTSGTVALELATRFRSDFHSDMRSLNIPPHWDVKTVGIELMPPSKRATHYSTEGVPTLDLRGYIYRREVQELVRAGMPPFDVNLVVDVGSGLFDPGVVEFEVLDEIAAKAIARILKATVAEDEQPRIAAVAPSGNPVTVRNGGVHADDKQMEVGRFYLISYRNRTLALRKNTDETVQVYGLPQ